MFLGCSASANLADSAEDGQRRATAGAAVPRRGVNAMDAFCHNRSHSGSTAGVAASGGATATPPARRAPGGLRGSASLQPPALNISYPPFERAPPAGLPGSGLVRPGGGREADSAIAEEGQTSSGEASRSSRGSAAGPLAPRRGEGCQRPRVPGAACP